MPKAFADFFSNEPFWAIVVFIFMLLPVFGIIAWVIFRAFRRNETKEIIDHDKNNSIPGNGSIGRS